MPPAPPKESKQFPGLPAEFKTFSLSQTKGLNTKDARSAIDDQELSWQENFLRIGAGNLRTTPDNGADLYTPSGGRTIISFFPFNIGATFYHAVFLNDGTADQVRISDGAVTPISAVAGTFWVAGNERPGCSQWGAQYLLIVSQLGYWVWNGTLLFGPGTVSPIVTITKSGTGYTGAPTVSATRGGGVAVTGFAATATVSNGAVTGVTITNPGSGVPAGDFINIILDGGQPFDNTARGHAVLTGKVVTSIVLDAAGGTGYTLPPTVIIVGGSGAGATATATVGGGSVTGFTVTNGGDGYLTAPTVIIKAAAGDNLRLAEAVINPMPIGLVGTAIETFQSRVWITNNDTITFSAPGLFDIFATSAGGGTVQSTDNFLKVHFPAIKQANGYLYPFGDSSIQVISNVQTAGSPVTTSFNNANTDPENGTPWRDTVQAFGRSLMFANETGIYGLFGGTAEKISEKLDGIFLAVPNRHATDIAEPSACIATLYEIKCYCCLIPILDPFTGLTRNAMVCFDGQTWFVGSQTKSLTFIATEMQQSQPLAWGTDGATLFPLFNTPNLVLPKIAQSKLWSGDGFIVYKQVLAFYTQLEDNSGLGVALTVTLDTQTTPNTIQVNANSTFSWINNGGQVFTWINNLSQTFTWGATGAAITGQAAEQYGLLIGETINSTSEDFTIVATAIGYKNHATLGI